MTKAAAPPETASASPAAVRDRRRARGLTLWSILAVGLSPFSIPTFGVGFVLGVGLIVTAVILERRGLRARGPLVAGIVAVVISSISAGACGWLVLRPAEVTGREEVRQDRVEQRFDRAFDDAVRPPERDGEAGDVPRGDADAGIGADSRRSTPRETR